MDNITVKHGKRVNITSLPTPDQIATAIAGLRQAGIDLELAIQTVLAGAWMEYHAGGDDRMRIMREVAGVKLTSGLAQAMTRALSAIPRNKPESGSPKASEAVRFAISQAANIFQHDTNERRKKREAARAKQEEKKAERAKIDAELKALREAVKQEEQEDAPPEVTMPEFAIVGENGKVELQFAPDELAKILDIVTRELRAQKAKLSVAS